MVVHNVTADMKSASAVSVSASVIRVTQTRELASALAQRNNPVVIENEDLERKFSALARWQSRENTIRFVAILVTALLALAIAQQYKLDFSWRSDWKLERIDGKIVLTPSKKD